MKTTEFDCFIYTHIPKCGGTSFRDYLNKAALNSGVSKCEIYIPGFNGIPNEKNVTQLSPAELAGLRKFDVKVWAGHHKFGELDDLRLLTGTNTFHYTILREPVQRFISHYNFFNFKLGNQGCKGKKLSDLTNDELDNIIKGLANVQTGYLSNIKFKNVFKPENVLKVAKYNLEYEYSGFGLLESMDKSNDRLNSQLPIFFKNSPAFPKKNENVLENKVSSKILKKIKNYNFLDIDLYNFAKERFESQGQNV